MSRPNKCIKDENGNECWISRSTVVIPIVFRLNEKTGDIYTLVEKRGPVVAHPYEWCCPCGYLDWDEDLNEACQREVKEETGLELDMQDIHFFEVRTDVQSRNQTVDIWYMCLAADGKDFDMDKVETKDEILELKWLKVGQFFKWGLFRNHIGLKLFMKTINEGYGTWAFKSHHKKIVEMLKNIMKDKRIVELDE